MRILDFSPELSEAVNQWLSDHNDHYKEGDNLSLSDLVEKWLKFQRKLTEGYELSIDDYRHELFHRDVLERLMVDVPSVRNALMNHIDHADAEFMANTEPNEAFAKFNGSGSGYPWEDRIPRVLVGELREDILSNNP